MEAYHGQVEVKSDGLGKGSCFAFTMKMSHSFEEKKELTSPDIFISKAAANRLSASNGEHDKKEASELIKAVERKRLKQDNSDLKEQVASSSNKLI